jgi:hypothetical protein
LRFYLNYSVNILRYSTIGALNDLDKAISLSKQYDDLKVLALACTQKGILLRLKGKPLVLFRVNILDKNRI